MATITKTVFTTGEAAKICKVSQQTIIRCFDNGTLKGFRVPGSRFRRIPRDQLFSFMKDNGIPTDALESGKRKLLIVDDDARNIFALSIVLENKDMEVLSATNGRQAIETIQNTPDLAVVLMDIMMPEMDGYQTMREIRKIPAFRTLPILALTAKAMKGDREKCLEAGASDYIAKPVNTEELLSLLRVWLHR